LEEIEEILGFFAKKKVIGVRENGRQEKFEENLRSKKTKMSNAEKLGRFRSFYGHEPLNRERTSSG